MYSKIGECILYSLTCRIFCVPDTQSQRLRFKHIAGYGYGIGLKIPHPMATLYDAEHVHILRTRARIPPTACFFTGQESESTPESGNVFKCAS